MEYLAMGAGGVLFGFMASLLGIGGGLFIIPWLTLVFNVPMHEAIATSLIAIIATSSGASLHYLKSGLPDLKLAFGLELTAATGGIVGGFLAGYISGKTLAMLFSIVLIYSAVTIFKGSSADSTSDSNPMEYQPKNHKLGFSSLFFAGNISGLLGVGGGIVKVPVLYLLMGVPLKVASATSNLMLGMTACASAFLFYFRGEVDFLITAAVVLGIFAGSRVGSLYLMKIKSSILKPAFAIILLVVAVRMMLKGLDISL